MLSSFFNIRPFNSLLFNLISKTYYFKGIKKNDLLIFDDIFPHPVSGFRLEEFTQLLLNFKKSKILTTGKAYQIINSKDNEHKIDIKNFKNQFPGLKNKIQAKSRFININTKLFYCIFLNNISLNLDWIEKYKIPFVFTLYPGGGFLIDDENCDLKLRKVFLSPQFRQVIVTQKLTLDYLIKKNFCTPNKINFIFGGAVPQNSLIKSLINKPQYLINKPTLDICFCAAKYMPKGIDKGYDVFIDLAHKLNSKYDFIRFHVIGGFDKNEINVSDLGINITFYGYQNFDNLNAIFRNIDIIISPNKPFFLSKGSFDGFPLGTIVEAVLNGVLALVTDQLNQNAVFDNHKDLIIINDNLSSIENEIVNLIENPQILINIAKNGKEKFQEIYSNNFQMKPRIEKLKNEIAANK